jgi:hypothetical protein
MNLLEDSMKIVNAIISENIATIETIAQKCRIECHPETSNEDHGHFLEIAKLFKELEPAEKVVYELYPKYKTLFDAAKAMNLEQSWQDEREKFVNEMKIKYPGRVV